MGEERIDQLAEDLAIVERVKRDAPIFLFRPLRAQREMISSDATYRCFFGGNRSGKTTVGLEEDVSYCIGFRPFLPPTHPRYRTPFKPPVRGMLIAQSWDKLEEVHVPELAKWIPKGWANPIKRQGYYRGFDFVSGPGSGSEIRFATYEMDPDKLESAKKHFYHFDEPPPFSHWNPVTRGIIDYEGKIWLTLTLLSEGWIWDEVWERAEAGDPDYFAVVGRMEENTFLPDGSVERFAKTLDDTEKEVRLYGRPQHLQGRVFKDFQVKEPWVVQDWDIPREWPTIRAFDPHIAKPTAALWIKVTPADQLVVTDELYDESISTMDEFRFRVQEIEAKRHANIALSLMDSAGAAPGGLGGSSYFDLFKRYGLSCRASRKSNKHARLMDTADGFRVDSFTEQPRIVIFKSCQGLVWEIRRYVHPRLRSGSRTDRWKEIPDGPHKKDDDRIDCLLYAVAEHPRYEWLSPEVSLGMIAEDYDDRGYADAVVDSPY